MERAQKQQVIESIQNELSTAKSVVVVHYKGMTVKQFTALRNKARKEGVFVQVAKNSLAKRAIENTPFKGLKDLFAGPTAIAYSAKDEVAPAKAVVTFGKENENLKILGGAIGESVLDVNGVESVASMPSLNESRAKIIGLINAPATKLVRLLQTPGGQVARVIKAKSEKA